MLDAAPFLCKYFHYRANPFSCWVQYLSSARISTTDLALFHVGCSTQHLHLTMGGTTYHQVRKAQQLYLTMGGLAYHHVRKAHEIITSPWKEPRSGEYQASP